MAIISTIPNRLLQIAGESNKEQGGGKREEGRGKREEGRGKREEGRGKSDCGERVRKSSLFFFVRVLFDRSYDQKQSMRST
jgi:hypothetical protein